jgi:hypothetical protein
MWSLSNAFTSAFKELEPIPQFRATARLAGFLKLRLRHISISPTDLFWWKGLSSRPFPGRFGGFRIPGEKGICTKPLRGRRTPAFCVV